MWASPSTGADAIGRAAGQRPDVTKSTWTAFAPRPTILLRTSASRRATRLRAQAAVLCLRLQLVERFAPKLVLAGRRTEEEIEDARVTFGHTAVRLVEHRRTEFDIGEPHADARRVVGGDDTHVVRVELSEVDRRGDGSGSVVDDLGAEPGEAGAVGDIGLECARRHELRTKRMQCSDDGAGRERVGTRRCQHVFEHRRGTTADHSDAEHDNETDRPSAGSARLRVVRRSSGGGGACV